MIQLRGHVLVGGGLGGDAVFCLGFRVDLGFRIDLGFRVGTRSVRNSALYP